MKGSCADSPMPDDWFPEFLSGGSNSNAYKKRLAVSVVNAQETCSTCPIKDECLEIGMETDNLPHGIWGGVLAGTRLRSKGYALEDYNDITQPIAKAINFERVMQPYLDREKQLRYETISTSNSFSPAGNLGN